MKKIWIRTLPGVAWFFLVLVLMCLPGDEFPKEDWMEKIYLDKVIHTGVFGVLAFLFIWPAVHAATSTARLKGLSILVVACVSIFGLIIEFIQLYFIRGRSFDILDWVADTAGAVMAGFFALYIFKKKLGPVSL